MPQNLNLVTAYYIVYAGFSSVARSVRGLPFVLERKYYCSFVYGHSGDTAAHCTAVDVTISL